MSFNLSDLAEGSADISDATAPVLGAAGAKSANNGNDGAGKSPSVTDSPGATNPPSANPLANLSKDYDMISIKRDAMFHDLVRATEIVREFVIKHGLIIYGGTAIDMALRLRGDKIYPDEMLQVPDLDFFSPDSVRHSYELADILFKAGFEETRSINAIHFTARKVDIGDGHYVADIAYIPREIFDTLPALVYRGMKIIHPMFQRIDMHSAFSQPYDNPPQEVVCHRWRKDFKRFWQLEKAYPVAEFIADMDLPTGNPAPRSAISVTIPREMWSGRVLAGWAAAEIHRGAASVDAAGGISLMAPAIEWLAEEEPPGVVATWEKYHSILLPKWECEPHGGVPVYVWNTDGHLITTQRVTIDGVTVDIISTHAIAKYLLAQHFYHLHGSNSSSGSNKGADPAYLAAYAALSPWGGFSTTVFGKNNMSTMRKVMLNGQDHDIDGTPLFVRPRNYHPVRQGEHPEFDVSASPYFAESGKRIPVAMTPP